MFIAIDVTRPCQEAVRGIVANRDQVSAVHFIHPTYESDEVSMYEGWAEDREKLEKSNVSVHFDAKLNAKNFADAPAIVEVPPNCHMTLGAFETIREQIKTANERQTHFSLATATNLEGFSLFHGFLVVLTVIEWLWNRIFERNKLMERTDVRGRFMIRKGNTSFLPSEHEFGWRVWNGNVMPKVYSGDVATLRGDLNIIWRLKHQAHMGFGLWLFPFIGLWLTLSVTWSTTAWAAITFRSIFMGTYAFLVWGTEIVLAWLICGHYIKSKWNYLFYFAFPAYFLAFPFMLVYSKLKIN